MMEIYENDCLIVFSLLSTSIYWKYLGARLFWIVFFRRVSGKICSERPLLPKMMLKMRKSCGISSSSIVSIILLHYSAFFYLLQYFVTCLVLKREGVDRKFSAHSLFCVKLFLLPNFRRKAGIVFDRRGRAGIRFSLDVSKCWDYKKIIYTNFFRINK